jgi:hypothetical protein
MIGTSTTLPSSRVNGPTAVAVGVNGYFQAAMR